MPGLGCRGEGVGVPQISDGEGREGRRVGRCQGPAPADLDVCDCGSFSGDGGIWKARGDGDVRLDVCDGRWVPGDGGIRSTRCVGNISLYSRVTGRLASKSDVGKTIGVSDVSVDVGDSRRSGRDGRIRGGIHRDHDGFCHCSLACVLVGMRVFWHWENGNGCRASSSAGDGSLSTGAFDAVNG